MRYDKPFTPEQRQNAIGIYRDYRRVLETIRHQFRPKTSEQRQVVREFRHAVRKFAEALRVENAKVNVVRLNALRENADRLAMQYSWLRFSSPGRPDDA